MERKRKVIKHCCGHNHNGHDKHEETKNCDSLHEEHGGCGCGKMHGTEKPQNDLTFGAHIGCGCGNAHGEEGTSVFNKKWVFFARVGLSAVLLLLGALLKLPQYVNLAFFIPSFLIIGIDVVYGAIKGLLHGKALDERLLMTIASMGAFFIGEAPEGVLVMILYQIGEFLTDLSVERSTKSISALTKLRPDFAIVKRSETEVKVSPEEVNVGDVIVVRPGERFPLDGIVIKGSTTVDLSALTGESVPMVKRVGEEVLSGAVNLEGVVEIEVTKPFGASAVMRILALVSEASNKKTKTERFIKKFAKIYTPVVVAVAALIAIVPSIITGEWVNYLNTAFVFLVISCPCALVISVPLTYFAGVGGASRQGILVKGGGTFDTLKKVKNVVFDKTGTLTEGVFEVTAINAVGADEAILKRMVGAAESMSNHPIAKSIIRAFGIPNGSVTEYKEIAGKGVSVVFCGEEILAGNEKLIEQNGILFAKETSASSVVYVAVNGKFIGSVTVSDKIKQSAVATIQALKNQRIKTVMLTGDREEVAAEIAQALSIDSYRAGLLPGEKVAALEEILTSGATAFVGDGVNDAPVITRADVGFAMGGMGQDAAIEAADVVIMNDDPMKVVKSIKIAKKTGRIALFNIAFALAVKVSFMILGVMGIANMWLAVFADVGVTLIAVVNAMRAYLKIK